MNFRSVSQMFGTSILTMAAMTAMPAWAEETNGTPSPDDEARGEDIVVTGVVDQLRLQSKSEGSSRLGLTILETPASVEIIDGDAIRLRGDVTIQEAAGRATGIVNTSGVFGFNMSSRGFQGTNSVMTLYDGMRMYNNTLTFPADAWMAQSVEVLRGPASVLYGEGAIGGAVNVVRKQPTADFQNALRASIGSWGTWSIAGGSGGPINEKISYRVDASYRSSNGWMERGESSSIAVSGALRFKATEDLTFTISHDYSVQKPRIWFGVPLIDGKLDTSIRKNNYNVSDAELRFRDNWTQFKVDWEPSDDLAVHSTFYHLTANKYWYNSENATWVAASGDTPASIRQSSFLELYHIQQQTGNRTTATFSSDLGGGVTNRVVIGGDANNISYKNVSNSGNNATRLVSIDNPVVGEFIHQTGSAATQARYTNTIHQFAVFAEDRLALGDAFSLVGGLRYDRPEITKKDYVTPTNNFTATPDAVTWRLGTVYNPLKTMSLYVSFATAADPVGALVSTSLSQSARDLSTGKQWEAGIKHAFWDGRAQWTLAAYKIVKKKLLVSINNSSEQQQVGQQSSKGIEASLSIEPIRGLNINVNGALLDAQYDDFTELVSGVLIQRAGNRPTNVANKMANLFVSWDFAPDWIVDGGVSYVGDRYADTANTRHLPSYTLTDVGLRWAFLEKMSVSVRVRNVFDEIYPKATYNSGNQWVLGDPRSFELAINAAF